MPELPDIEAYLAALRHRVLGTRLAAIRIVNPFLLRSVTPPLDAARDRRVTGLRRIGKRIVFELEGELFVVLHLMVAGRLRWDPLGAKVPGKVGLAAFDFVPGEPMLAQGHDGSAAGGTLVLTEAGSKRRASLSLVEGEAGLARVDPGGREPLGLTVVELGELLGRERHTLKRALTDPRLLSGIGNAYSDEILHRARLSPFALTTGLDPDELGRLHAAIGAVLGEWRDRLVAEAGRGFPAKVTAFRPEMAVHGKYAKPCPVCGSPVQRLVYAENEANYCAVCQTGGRVLADRALSRLLKDDWPRTLAELEERFAARFGAGR